MHLESDVMFHEILLTFISVVIAVTFGGFAIVSIKEGEPRAAKLSATFALGGVALLLAVMSFPRLAEVLLLLLGLVGLVGVLLFFYPIGKVERVDEVPTQRFDERDVIFARAYLKPGSPEYEAFYTMRPENLPGDELTRSKPGLLSWESSYAQPLVFASAQGSFTLTEALHHAVDGNPSPKKYALNKEKMTAYIKNLARYFGACEVGITELKPYHVYSHIGRGTGIYGAPIAIEHRFAIAFTVEMDHQMIGANPEPPGVMESAKQYVEAARIAVQLAACIRHLGYSARAHIDGNYRVIAPLVARDAGLGEIGRMGILMTPFQGPRVRINVVTTNLELMTDRPTRNPSVIDFCKVCQKCAENCPVKAIPFGDRQEIDGALRWRINADTCFRYWNVIGTDCGRCLTVCPFSHPNHFYHNIMRWGISKSGAFRRFALKVDDIFYGTHPLPRKTPRWISYDRQ